MMNCKNCGYNILGEYMNVLCDGKKSKFVKIVNVHPAYSMESFDDCSWDVECICPKCKTQWVFSDSNW